MTDLAAADWRAFKALVLAPGVPLTHPEPHWTVRRAQEAGVPVIGDIELFARERAARAPDAPFVAITGTNGKSTTTALIAHVLREAGRDVALGGNIGVPILDLPPPADTRMHVIECSSYQIDLAPSLAPTVGLLINITPDHLDRHGDLAGYAAVKERLVAKAEIALVGVDDEPSRAICARLKADPNRRVVAVSGGESPLADVFVAGHRRRRARAPPSRRSILATRARCAAPTTARTPLSPMRRRPRSAFRATPSRGRSRPFRAWRTGWRKSAGAAACCSSTIRRRPTPTPPRRRCCRFATSTGFSAARPRPAASNRCVRSFRGSPRPI